MQNKSKKHTSLISVLILSVLVLVSPKLGVAESISGAVYSLEGGVVYQAGDLSGSTYSLSGSGDVVVGSSAGGSFTQNQGEFGGGNVTPPTPSGSTPASGANTSGGVGYSTPAGTGGLIINAYSYYKKDLTLIATFTNPKDVGSLVLVGQTNLSPLYFTALNQNTFLIRFSDVNQGEYTLALGKPAYTVGSPLVLYSISVNKEGNGVVDGPDSTVVIDTESQAGLNPNQNIGTTSVSQNNIVKPSKPRAVDIKPAATSTTPIKSGVACKLFGIKCVYLPPIYILLVCIIGYLTHKFVISRGKDVAKIE